MNWRWLFNGSLEAHHLLAAYVLVWVVQGGYALWVARRLAQTARSGEDQPAAPFSGESDNRSDQSSGQLPGGQSGRHS